MSSYDGSPSYITDQALLLPPMLHHIEERVSVDGYALQLRHPRLPIEELRLHQAEGRLLQLVQRMDSTRQIRNQHHGPLSPLGPVAPETVKGQ